MGNSLREALDAAVAGQETEQEVISPMISDTQDTPEPSPVEPVAPIEPDVPATKDIPTKDDPGAPEEPVKTSEDKPDTPTADARAPASWKGDAKKVWDQLPPVARAEVTRRESQINNVLKENSQARAIINDMQNSIAPYQDRLRELNTPPAAMFNRLMRVEMELAKGQPQSKAQVIADLINEYKVDINTLDAVLSGGQPATARQPDQDIERRVQQLLDQRLAPIQQRMQQDEQSKVQELSTTINSMAQDPRYPYFEDVREDMADLIEIKAQRGIYMSLEQAYSLATSGNPAVAQSQSMEQQRSDALHQSAVAQKAKAASVSVGGSPSSVTSGTDPRNLRAAIENVYDNH